MSGCLRLLSQCFFPPIQLQEFLSEPQGAPGTSSGGLAFIVGFLTTDAATIKDMMAVETCAKVSAVE